ncbi:hypothetical protein [Emticicia sp.]|uniref:hypothetical protein n=1 Tax=Emticicia sp. TaxID=1930953 RepID=UPI003750039D
MKKLILALYLLFGASQFLQAQSITLQPNTGNNGNLLIKSTSFTYGNVSTSDAGGADLFFRRSEPANDVGATGTLVGAISTRSDKFQINAYDNHYLNFYVNSRNAFRILTNGYTGVNTTVPSRFFHVKGSTILSETSDSANVQIGTTTSNFAKLVVSSSGFPNGVFIDALNTGGGHALNVNGSTNLNGTTFISGSLAVSGSLSKGSGSFKIDHPLDPENKYLYHSFVESPDMMNVYNGNTTTDKKGYATITLPDYFEALNTDFRYQLTAIGTFTQVIVCEKVQHNQFKIKTKKPNVEVSWQVTGIRNDAFAKQNRIPNTVEKPAEEKGLYLHPAAFDLPPSKNVLNAKKNTVN